MNLNPFSWFNFGRIRPVREPEAQRLYLMGDSSPPAGVRITHDEAMRISAVWACVTAISKALASCEWNVLDLDADGNAVHRRNTPLYRLLNTRPNSEMSAFSWRESRIITACLHGNSFDEIERDALNRPIALHPLDPERCTLVRDLETSELLLRVNQQGGGQVFLPYRDVYHIKGPSPDGLEGYDTVLMALRSFSQAKAAEQFANAFYGNGTSFGGILSAPGMVSAEKKNELREAIEKGHKGAEKAFRFMVLDGGLTYSKLTVTPEEAEYIETRHLVIEEVCRWFGVPPHKIAHLIRSTYNNIEHLSIEFVRDALIPWAERLRQEADWKLTVVPFRRTRLELDWLAEGDAVAKAEADSRLIIHAIKTPNEVRRARGMNALGPEADKLLVQIQMAPLEMAGKHLEESEPVSEPEEEEDDVDSDEEER